jgi:dihydrofolate reductase
MRRLIGAAFVSLDGVMQAPGGPDEDPTGGFALGGWLFHYFDDAVGDRIDALFGGDFDLLLGRRTYDIFAAYWPFAQGEEKALGDRFDRAAKYVVTRGDRPLEWQNSHRLASLDALAEVKRGEGPDLVIQGSSTLYPQLLAAGLIDRLVLMTFPLVLGSGKRLFGDGTPPGSMRMTDHEVTPRGNIIATYEPAGEIEPGSFVTTAPGAAERERRRRMAEGGW